MQKDNHFVFPKRPLICPTEPKCLVGWGWSGKRTPVGQLMIQWLWGMMMVTPRKCQCVDWIPIKWPRAEWKNHSLGDIAWLIICHFEGKLLLHSDDIRSPSIFSIVNPSLCKRGAIQTIPPESGKCQQIFLA